LVLFFNHFIPPDKSNFSAFGGGFDGGGKSSIGGGGGGPSPEKSTLVSFLTSFFSSFFSSTFLFPNKIIVVRNHLSAESRRGEDGGINGWDNVKEVFLINVRVSAKVFSSGSDGNASISGDLKPTFGVTHDVLPGINKERLADGEVSLEDGLVGNAILSHGSSQLE